MRSSSGDEEAFPKVPVAPSPAQGGTTSHSRLTNGSPGGLGTGNLTSAKRRPTQPPVDIEDQDPTQMLNTWLGELDLLQRVRREIELLMSSGCVVCPCSFLTQSFSNLALLILFLTCFWTNRCASDDGRFEAQFRGKSSNGQRSHLECMSKHLIEHSTGATPTKLCVGMDRKGTSTKHKEGSTEKQPKVQYSQTTMMFF